MTTTATKTKPQAEDTRPAQQQSQAVATQQQHRDPITTFKAQVANSESEFRAALPAHIPVERFMRVVTTAVVSNPDLLKADRRSLFEAAVKAAQDGLLPDGRDGAIVTYGSKATWMPMIGGILKKVRNSGELLSISAYVVYEHDEFVYELGDKEQITHKPALEDRGKPRLAYAVAKTKDGGIYREVMTILEIEQVRSVSKAKNNGPWVSWWSEMARKTVLRRLSKRLPMSSDLDDLIRRDDELYDMAGARDTAKELAGGRPHTLAGKLDFLASGGTSKQTIEHDPETGEIAEQQESSSGAPAAPEATEAGAEQAPRESEAASDVGAQNAAQGDAPAADDGGFPGDEPTGGVTEDERLYMAAREVAEEGRRAFDAYYNRLRPEQRESLKPRMAGLMKLANAVGGGQ